MNATSSAILQTLQDINNNYSNLLLVVIAIVTATVAYREYSLRKRPYVIPEIAFEKNGESWFFHIVLVNKGERPGIAKITKALLKIGDEDYPTVFKNEIVLAQGDRQKLAPIGHINKKGRDKIIGHEYKNNRLEIHICLESKAIGDKAYKFQTKAEYLVDVFQDDPIITLVSEEMH